ncbi:hypothetical protein FGO68_gene16294 [Halteria grandinella]|uniref:Uncharacterized protein n=1 Tax=Halteria grandinella TaxID=5974 RepID=A0A8J8P7A6_HALGN|nr:hypothetical protein FGO68_gene16294 [Halteria grandinella]
MLLSTLKMHSVFHLQTCKLRIFNLRIIQFRFLNGLVNQYLKNFQFQRNLLQYLKITGFTQIDNRRCFMELQLRKNQGRRLCLRQTSSYILNNTTLISNLYDIKLNYAVTLTNNNLMLSSLLKILLHMDTKVNEQHLKNSINRAVGIMTVIQKYLPTNFSYTQIAIINKRIREALNASGLRNGRNLIIHVPQQISNLNSLSILKMVQFSECITIKIGNKDGQNQDEFLKNLEILCQFLF